MSKQAQNIILFCKKANNSNNNSYSTLSSIKDETFLSDQQSRTKTVHLKSYTIMEKQEILTFEEDLLIFLLIAYLSNPSR